LHNKVAIHVFLAGQSQSIKLALHAGGPTLVHGTVIYFVNTTIHTVTIHTDLSPSVYINDIVRKAHTRANMIHRCFLSRNVTLLVRAFVTYVRPLLEYNSVVWSPGLVRDVMLIEQVQRRFTKRLRGFRNISYAERLKLLNLDTLEARRLKFDLIYCYKIIFGLVPVNSDEFFELATSRTRGHPFKLYKHFSSSTRSSFVSERIINSWNRLPDSVDFSSLHKFRNSIDAIDCSLLTG